MQDVTPDEIVLDPLEKITTVRLSELSQNKLLSAAKTTGLKKSDVLRLSIDRGIDLLLSQLAPKQAPVNAEPTATLP